MDSQLTLWLLQLLQDRLLQVLWLRSACPSSLDLAITTNQELLEVPLDPLQPEEAWVRLLEPFVQRGRLVPVHISLAHDGEGDAVVH